MLMVKSICDCAFNGLGFCAMAPKQKQFSQAPAMSIGFSVLVAGLAAMNLALDFDFIDKAEAAGAPKHMEWFAAFGIMVTLVWLYMEILRLLAKMRDR